ncbi:class II fumarate hydratase [Candidatus Marinimicrobia bacterium]|jgi:fumarate hydratase class II|nr:class II fumarate hydratase [bacterium]MDA7641993.1 class II fumarate hydratase [Candidatus Neomarinimicrobiota bacterium]MDA7685605.1 class II fumarate hydratase [Candidatus Neomarinimicrobiota bacterium]MDA9841347.1 class II fumarate hydratase [Candidatus Neomarinimicrobiota bacterium]MDB3979866.1 class II fumarate hydratase [Candidatus Neomarinimicrobiota bacterium]
MTKFRTEKDSLGEVKVPHNAYYGAQTQRAVENFEIGWPMEFSLILPYIIIKKAAAMTNHAQKKLPKKLSDAIMKACDDITDHPEKFIDQFPVPVFQTGSGTQTNMNVNEVVANRANEILGGNLGEYKFVHPNDHVNMSQSTNDTFPTAILVGCVLSVEDNLLPILSLLEKSLQKKSREFDKIIKVGRTHLQDATPIKLGQEFSGYASMISNDIKRIKLAVKECAELPIGGTAVGTGINTLEGFDTLVCSFITEETDIEFSVCTNKFELLSSQNPLSNLSSQLKICAGSLNKIANDIRWLASGPMAGIGELKLPSNEPGSSIMPGKVNPTQCEAVNMVYAQILGNDLTINYAGTNGNFELNTYRPIIASSIHESITLLSEVSESFTLNALDGLKANKEKIKENLDKSLMLVTALNPVIGYEKSAEIAKKALKENISLKESAKKLKYLSEQEFDEIVKPELMVSPKKYD